MWKFHQFHRSSFDTGYSVCSHQTISTDLFRLMKPKKRGGKLYDRTDNSSESCVDLLHKYQLVFKHKHVYYCDQHHVCWQPKRQRTPSSDTVHVLFIRPIVKYCTTIATAKEVLQLIQDDLDNETIKLMDQDTLGGQVDGLSKKLEKQDTKEVPLKWRSCH